MTGDERLCLERQVVSASIDSWECLITSLDILPPKPFRSLEADELDRVFYWAAAMWECGEYNDVANRDRLLDAMIANRWPAGWLDAEREGWLETQLAWTPIIYEAEGLGAICQVLEEDSAALDMLVASRQRTLTDPHVRRALGRAAPRTLQRSVRRQGAGAF